MKNEKYSLKFLLQSIIRLVALMYRAVQSIGSSVQLDVLL